MGRSKYGIYFDKQDSDILALVNRIQESHAAPAAPGQTEAQTCPLVGISAQRPPSEDRLFAPNLHPHGIKEMVGTPVSRMAYAVINLLHNLEAGGAQARDRLLALQTLYDEVLNSAHSAGS